jgi:hypothetical protein
MTTLTQLSTKAPTLCDRPEVELLLCCARTHIDSETAERIETLLQQDIDWAYLIQTAGSHGVIPLLYQSLSTTSPEAVPKAILSQLRNYFHTNAQRNLFMTGELLKLLNLFEQHEIRVIPFKGPVLAASVYGNLALRQFCDLDILVHQRDIVRAKNLLICEGYQLHHELIWQSCFVNKDSRVNVELHQRITPLHFSLQLDFDGLWQRLEPISLAGKTVPNFAPEDLLLILCIYVSRDFMERRERLAQNCDVAELIRSHQSMDWNQVMEQARLLGCQRILFLGLLLVTDLLGTTLPEKVLQKMQSSPVVKLLAAQVGKQLFCETKDKPKLFEGSRFYLRARERLQDKVLFFITPNFEDRMFLPLPSFLGFLYYLIRPIRLVAKYVLILFKSLL